MPATPAPAFPRLVHSTVYENGRVLATGPVTLHGLIGYNSGAAQFIQLHDAIAAPADTTVPDATFYVAATSNFSLAATLAGLRFETGLFVCNSSTGPTKTIGAADVFFTASIQ